MVPLVHRRLLKGARRALGAAALLALGACEFLPALPLELPHAEPPTCPEGTVLRGNQCAPDVELAPRDPRTVIEPDAGADDDAGPEPEPEPEPEPDVPGDVTLPFFIEEHYIMSGFFSETGSASTERLACSGVPGTKPGATCIGVTFTPNGDAWGGFFFQYPENNFGASPGLDVPPGAQQVRFRAWGQSGGETVKFGAGINNDLPFSDGFNVEKSLTLTTTPTESFIDLRNVTYDLVAGGFLWVAETPGGSGDVTFFMDNIEWTTDPVIDEAVPIPFWVDDHYVMSGFFPGPPATVEVEEGCPGVAGTDPASVCRRITLTPNGSTFGGFYFQYPENNFGAEPGKWIAPGATAITFRAWGATGGELLGFGAGLDNDLPNDDGWHVETAPAPLSTTPTAYSLDIGNISYDEVAGAFLWVASTPNGATPVTFFLDNIRWE